jgi:hypothetical protein
LRLIAGVVLAVLGAVVFAYGVGAVGYVQLIWTDCHDPEFLVDFSYQCRFLSLDIFMIGFLLLGGSLLTALSVWAVINPRQKRWKPPKSIVT